MNKNKRKNQDEATFLKKVTGRGISLQLFSSICQTIVRLGASAIIARILTPYDYGLFGMAVLTSNFIACVTRFGMDVAIIVKSSVNDRDLNTCFWTMGASRIIMFAIAFMVAPVAAVFFNEPRVEMILKVISFMFILTIPSIIPSILMTKNMEFTPKILIESAGMFFESFTAVILVLTTDLAYWSLVYAMIVGAVFTNTALFLYRRWLPRFVFDADSFRFQFKYGISNLGTTALDFLKANIDYILIGRILGANALGYYEFAFRIPHLVYEKIVRPSTGIIFPAFSKLQGDNQKINTGFITTASYYAIFILPALVFLAWFAEPIVLLIWGQQWLPIVVPLQILCIASLLLSIFNPIFPVFLCKGRPEIGLIYSSAQVPLTFGLVYILGKYYGVTGVAVAMAISAVLILSLLIPLKRITQIELLEFSTEILRPAICTAISLTAAHGINCLLTPHLAYYLNLTIVSGVYVAAYFLTFYLLFPDKTREICNDLKLIIKRE